MPDWLTFREPVSAWTHGLWLMLAPVAFVLLWRAGRGDRLKQVGFLIYALSLTACYAGSTVFHAVRLPPDRVDFFELLDCIGIFLFIAGTLTPAALVLLHGHWRRGTLAAAWSLAAAGIGLHLMAAPLPPGLRTGLYLAMGWCMLLCYFTMARAVGHRALRLAVVGGALYSFGAVLNLAGWPRLWPGVVGPHEVFHGFVMAGTLAHFGFLLRVVAPFNRRELRAIVSSDPRPVWQRVKERRFLATTHPNPPPPGGRESAPAAAGPPTGPEVDIAGLLPGGQSRLGR